MIFRLLYHASAPRHRAAVDALERHAQAEGRGRVTLMVEPDNHVAIAFYQVLGYWHFKDSEFRWDGQVHPVFCFEKRLRKI